MTQNSNGCNRCPEQPEPCTEARHSCPTCNGLGITADYKLCTTYHGKLGTTAGEIELGSVLGKMGTQPKIRAHKKRRKAA